MDNALRSYKAAFRFRGSPTTFITAPVMFNGILARFVVVDQDDVIANYALGSKWTIGPVRSVMGHLV